MFRDIRLTLSKRMSSTEDASAHLIAVTEGYQIMCFENTTLKETKQKLEVINHNLFSEIFDGINELVDYDPYMRREVFLKLEESLEKHLSAKECSSVEKESSMKGRSSMEVEID